MFQVSTGLRQLDEIVGGGFLSGSIVALEEEEAEFSSYGESILKYRCIYFISVYCWLA
jgi:hypothetical protein